MARLLSFMIHENRSGIFAAPVTDEVAPGYSEVVGRPMDLFTMSRRLAHGVYSGTGGPQRFRVDAEQIAINALAYNSRGDKTWKEARRFLLALSRATDAVFPFTHNGAFAAKIAAALAQP